MNKDEPAKEIIPTFNSETDKIALPKKKENEESNRESMQDSNDEKPEWEKKETEQKETGQKEARQKDPRERDWSNKPEAKNKYLDFGLAVWAQICSFFGIWKSVWESLFFLLLINVVIASILVGADWLGGNPTGFMIKVMHICMAACSIKCVVLVFTNKEDKIGKKIRDSLTGGER